MKKSKLIVELPGTLSADKAAIKKWEQLLAEILTESQPQNTSPSRPAASRKYPGAAEKVKLK